MPLLGILILDRDPFTLADLGGLLQAWLQDAGGFAAVGLLVYLAYALFGSGDHPESTRQRMPITTFMLGMAVACLLLYAAYLALQFAGIGAAPNTRPPVQPGELDRYVAPVFQLSPQPLLLMLGGLCAILGIGQPFARDFFKLRTRRIVALAKVCFLEAIRNRVFLVFLVYLLVFFFPSTWFSNVKSEDQLRTPMAIFSVAKNLLITIPFLMLAAFAIPNDVKYQTIYTLVSKPVERFEIVLGKFLGYTGFMTLALLGMVLASVLYIYTTKLDEKAVEETFKARVTVRGKIDFKSRKQDFVGTNVGREFDYRKYIGGAKESPERALWHFRDVPANLCAPGREVVPCEFTFDIFRLTKGEENRGVDVNIRFTSWQNQQMPSPVRGDGTWRWIDGEMAKKYDEDRKAINEKLKTGGYGPGYPRSLDYATPADKGWQLVNDLAKKYGFYEVPTKEVYDYHPTGVPVPAGLFEHAREGDAMYKDIRLPRLTVAVKCLSGGQMLGMAEGDLYLLEGEKSFAENYFKSAFGLWCRVVIVIGVAVTLSTYLAGIISGLAAAFLYISGYFAEHLQDVATGTSTGGGPFESLTRLLRTDGPTAQLDNSAGVKAATILDSGYAWVFRRFTNVVPDVDAFTWTAYLSEGFNINVEYLIVNLLLLVGYLLPWGVLAYYLMRNREVAA